MMLCPSKVLTYNLPYHVLSLPCFETEVSKICILPTSSTGLQHGYSGYFARHNHVTDTHGQLPGDASTGPALAEAGMYYICRSSYVARCWNFLPPRAARAERSSQPSIPRRLLECCVLRGLFSVFASPVPAAQTELS